MADSPLFGGGSQRTVTIEQPVAPATPQVPFQPPPPPDFGSFEPPAPAQFPPEYQDYLNKSLKGELPVSQATEQDIATKRGQLAQALARSEGPDWQTSTAGVQALTQFDQKAEAARDAERHGNPQLANSILQGVIATNAANQRSALEAFQAEMQAGMEEYQAQLEGALAAYKAQYGSGGTQRTSTTTGSSGGGAGSLLGGVGGIGAAALLSAKKPWWAPDPTSGERGPGSDSPILGVGELDTGMRGGGGSVGDYNYAGTNFTLPSAPDYSQWLDPGAQDFSGVSNMLDAGAFSGYGSGLDMSGFNLADLYPSFSPNYGFGFDPSSFDFGGGFNFGNSFNFGSGLDLGGSLDFGSGFDLSGLGLENY